MLYKKLRQDIKFLSYRLVFYYNKYYAEAFILKKRDKVYLLQKNIKTTRSSEKLNYIKIKPFRIIRNIKNISFKLDLSEEIKRKYLVFHVLLLEPVSEKVLMLKQVSDNYLIEQEEWYKVKKILEHKEIQDQ